MSEFHASLLLGQMTRLPEQTRTREQNAQYLTSILREIPGILPAGHYEGCTRNAYHLYMFRYKKELVGNLPRSKFLNALSAEGIPASSGYTPLNQKLDGSYRRLRVKVKASERVFVRARAGYRATPDSVARTSQ